MLDESNAQIPNTTTLGPLREGHRFTSTCEVRNTRPAPLVGWYRADKKLTAAVTQEEQDGLFTVKAVLSLMLSRQELDSYLECRVETRALSNVVRNQIHIDLQGGFERRGFCIELLSTELFSITLQFAPPRLSWPA